MIVDTNVITKDTWKMPEPKKEASPLLQLPQDENDGKKNSGRSGNSGGSKGR